MPDPRDGVPPCEICGGRGWIIEADGGAGAARPCPCRASRDPVPGLLAAARIPERYLTCTLDNFEVTNPNPRYHEQLVAARALTRRYIEGFYLGDKGRFREFGLLFVGPPGGGKTHLAAAVLVELIRRYHVRGLFADFTSLVHEIQSTFAPGSSASKHAILDPVMEAEVLVLDELGAQKPSNWVSELLYLILNTRYGRRLPTLFTTNFRLEQAPRGTLSLDRRASSEDSALLSARVPASVLSRLFEMAKPVRLEVDDFRREVKVGQHGL